MGLHTSIPQTFISFTVELTLFFFFSDTSQKLLDQFQIGTAIEV